MKGRNPDAPRDNNTTGVVNLVRFPSVAQFRQFRIEINLALYFVYTITG